MGLRSTPQNTDMRSFDERKCATTQTLTISNSNQTQGPQQTCIPLALKIQDFNENTMKIQTHGQMT